MGKVEERSCLAGECDKPITEVKAYKKRKILKHVLANKNVQLLCHMTDNLLILSMIRTSLFYHSILHRPLSCPTILPESSLFKGFHYKTDGQSKFKNESKINLNNWHNDNNCTMATAAVIALR